MVTISQLNLKKKKRNRISQKLRCPALIGGPFRRGTIERVFIRNPKKPNSAKRKVCKVIIKMTKRRVDSYIPGIGHSLQKFSQVLIKGGRCQDVPGVRYTCVKGLLDFSYREGFIRTNRRSLYGIPRTKKQFF